MEKTKEFFYESPKVEIIELNVEKGFATSIGDMEYEDEIFE